MVWYVHGSPGMCSNGAPAAVAVLLVLVVWGP